MKKLLFALASAVAISAVAHAEDAKEVAVLATVLAIGSYLAFIVLLKLQFPVWPTFLS